MGYSPPLGRPHIPIAAVSVRTSLTNQLKWDIFLPFLDASWVYRGVCNHARHIRRWNGMRYAPEKDAGRGPQGKPIDPRKSTVTNPAGSGRAHSAITNLLFECGPDGSLVLRGVSKSTALLFVFSFDTTLIGTDRHRRHSIIRATVQGRRHAYNR